MPEDEQFGAMRRFQEEGKVRHLGLSEVAVAEIERARKVFPVVSIQNKYNLADREWESEVDYCQRAGIGFIPWFPLQVGRLAQDRALAQVAVSSAPRPTRWPWPGCCSDHP